MRLGDRIALVTGAATGLGRVYALRLADEGAHVCVADVNAPGAEETARMVETHGLGRQNGRYLRRRDL